MSSTFLALTNKVLEKFNETPLTAANFDSQQGIFALAKSAVNDAIRMINQQEFEWPFNYQNGSQTLVGTSGTQIYSLPSDYKVVDKDTVYMQRDASLNFHGVRLPIIEYDKWVKTYRGTDEDIIAEIADIESAPRYVFFTPNQEIGFTPPPSEDYVVDYHYWNSQADLSAYNDTTNIPPRFDYIIAFGAAIQLHQMRDNEESSRSTEARFKAGMKNMRKQLINRYDHATDARTSHAVENG